MDCQRQCQCLDGAVCDHITGLCPGDEESVFDRLRTNEIFDAGDETSEVHQNELLVKDVPVSEPLPLMRMCNSQHLLYNT